MSDSFSAALDRLSRISGVRGALIVDAVAGVPVTADLADEIAGPAVAALAASLFRRTSRATHAAAFGELDTLQLEADGGHVIVASAGDLLVVAVVAADAPLGLVRLEAHRAAESLR